MLLCLSGWWKCRSAVLGVEGHPGCTYLAEASLNVVAGGVSSVRITISLTDVLEILSQSH